ncbi:MAG: hypothetical protein E4H32_04360 [Nitrospirales bacterium]|nr:MAG: hypothetical protein E4H32_04360 [Nitrospirales bacterium]
MEQLFYIQDSRSYVGNEVVWWRPDGAGYTTDILDAGKYTFEQAKKICERDSDRAWPCEFVDSNTKVIVIVDMQKLHKDFEQKF